MKLPSGLSAALKAALLGSMAGMAAMAAAGTQAPEAPARQPGPTATVALPAAPLAVAGTLKPGLWEVRFTDGGGETVQKLCLADLSPLIQIRHPRSGCGRLVLTNEAAAATVQYSCPGAGWGRTALRASGRETVRIETQGVAANAPFAFSAVGRRTGDCAALAQAR